MNHKDIITRINLLENPNNVTVDILRDDLIHPFISGNKFRKLKYNLQEFETSQSDGILTFGGAFSNHIHATAYAGKLHDIKTIGYIRTDTIDLNNPTLKDASNWGMELIPIDRTNYKRRFDEYFLAELQLKHKNFYILPEGGSNDLSIKGTSEIIPNYHSYDYICSALGSGGTIAGILNSSQTHQTIEAYSSLKVAVLPKETKELIEGLKISSDRLQYFPETNFKGYGKYNDQLFEFCNNFFATYGIPLDWIYTGKMCYSILQKIKAGDYPANSKILIYHSGGLQGNRGIEYRLKKQIFNY